MLLLLHPSKELASRNGPRGEEGRRSERVKEGIHFIHTTYIGYSQHVSSHRIAKSPVTDIFVSSHSDLSRFLSGLSSLVLCSLPLVRRKESHPSIPFPARSRLLLNVKLIEVLYKYDQPAEQPPSKGDGSCN